MWQNNPFPSLCPARNTGVGRMEKYSLKQIFLSQQLIFPSPRHRCGGYLPSANTWQSKG